jgi:hydroxymethylglutaryl-CoA lyase
MAMPSEGRPASRFPRVEIVEEGLREGMQIESSTIPIEAKLTLLDALSLTGLSTIVVGSFVSPTWTPQMADVDELVRRMTPAPGVAYRALALNERGRERRAAYVPPLSVDETPATSVHLCDVFVRRNTNRTQAEEIAEWDRIIARALEVGATSAAIGVNAAWGSNWLGPFSAEQRMAMLVAQYEAWNAAGVAVRSITLGDPMGWNRPDVVAEQMDALRARFPDVTTIHLHLHDARGTALVSAYEALNHLGPEYTLILDASVGGMGGCPYGGHGRMTRMMPTEDLVDLLDELGIDTGVNLERLIDAALLAEQVVGHPLWGHVSKAGPRPRAGRLFPMDLPFIETEEQAQHFRVGPAAYVGARTPWRTPITSPARDAVDIIGAARDA